MKKSIKETVREAILPTVEELGYRIWDITYTKIGADYHLEITIDSDNGIEISDCEKVHRAIEVIIDEADPIDEMYYLDVSSPGLERVIRTAYHFEKCVGETVEIKLFAALDGKKSIVGELLSYDTESDNVRIKDRSGVEYTVARKQISKANVYFEL